MKQLRRGLMAVMVAGGIALILACGGAGGSGGGSEPDSTAKPRLVERVTRENYGKIKEGMTVAEVQAILGPGRESASSGGAQLGTWQSDSVLAPTIITVTFVEGRVAGKAIAP